MLDVIFFLFYCVFLDLQLTGILLVSDNLPILLILEGLMIGCLSWLAVKFRIFDIHLMRKKDWLVLLVGIVVTVLQSLFFWMLGRGGSGARDGIAQLDIHHLVVALFITIIGPTMEEMTTRGILQKGAFENSHFGILVASVLFAWLHTPYTLVGFLSYFSAGAIMGYMYKVSGNILPSICLHILNNSMAYLFMVL